MLSVIIHDLTGKIYSVIYGESTVPIGLKATLVNVPDNVQSIERMEGNTPVYEYMPQPALDSYETKIAKLTSELNDSKALLTAVGQVLSENITDAQAIRLADIYPEWIGDGVTYLANQKVRYKGVLYKVLTEHVSQDNWMPSYAPSLFAPIINNSDEDGNPPEWQQPDSTNPYMRGDVVIRNGKTYKSLIDANVWEPGVTGSETLWEELNNG